MNKKNIFLYTVIIASLLIIILLVSSQQNAPTSTDTATVDPIERLKIQNENYQIALSNDGDISPELREATVQNGQSPYA